MRFPSPFSSPRIIAPLLPSLLGLSLVLTGCGNEAGRSTDAGSGKQPAPTALQQPAPVLSAPPAPPQPPAAAPVSTAPGGAAASLPESGKGPGPAAGKAPKVKYLLGEDPEFAQRCGWPVACPPSLPGSVLPNKRIVAYYGNPQSRRMGALGEYPKEEMLRRLKEEAARWQAADPATPVQPALHLIAVVAQGLPGKAGKYRMVMPDAVVNQVYGWAKEANALLFIDIQTGHEDIRTLLPRFEWLLKNPDVHLGIDPEFNLVKGREVPGTKIGTFDADDINFVTDYLRELVRKYQLPPKVLTVHRFTRKGVTNSRRIELRPEVQVVMHMDGWGGPHLKRSTYKDYVVAEPVQFTGFKLFYHNDTKKGDPLLTPQQILKLNPKPVYIQYQ